MRTKVIESELWIKAKDFAYELTCHNVIEKGLRSKAQIKREHQANNKAVADILLARGIKTTTAN
jgi:DNA-damage-inducible protein D